MNGGLRIHPHSTHVSIDAVSSGSTGKTKSAVIAAVVVVIVVILFALGAVLYFCRRRRYKGYGPPMDHIFCKRSTGRGPGMHTSVDLVQDAWGEKGLPPQQSNPSIRVGLLKPGGVSRTQGTSSTLVGTSSASDKMSSAAPIKETHPPTLGVGLPAAKAPPPASQGLPPGPHGGSSPQVRHGHPATFQLPPLMIPDRHTQIAVSAQSNTSSSKTPPSLPSKTTLPHVMQGEAPPAGTRSTLPAVPNTSPPTSFPSPPSSLGSKRSKRQRPKSDPRSGIAARQEHIRLFPKRRSVANGAATPSTGSRTSGMIASDRTTASTPTSMMAPDGFCWDNTSMPDLPARADSVKTVSTMPLTGRVCDRIMGNVYVDSTPLPDNTVFPPRSNTDKSSDTMSPGTAWTTNGSSMSHGRSSISHAKSFSPPAALDELEPVPVVDRRPIVESPVSLPNSPNIPLLAATLQIVASAQMARMSAYSDGDVPIREPAPVREPMPLCEPVPIRDSESGPILADLPDQRAEDADVLDEKAAMVISPPLEAEADVEPSTSALRPSSQSSISITGSPKGDPSPLAAGPLEAQWAPPSPLVASIPEVPPSPLVASITEVPPPQLIASTPESPMSPPLTTRTLELPPSPLVAYADSPTLAIAEDPPEPVQHENPAPSDAVLVHPSVVALPEDREEPHPQPSHPVLSIIVQPDPPSRSTRMEGDRPRKLPPVPLPLVLKRLDTVHEDIVSPRFMRPLPVPQPQPGAARSTSLSSTIDSRNSVDTAEVAVGERFNVLSAVGHSLQVHSPQPSAPVLMTPCHDLFTQWHSDSSDASSVSSRPMATTREHSVSSVQLQVQNEPKLRSRPSLEKIDSSQSSIAESTPSVRALPLVPNRAPDVVLGTTLQVDRGHGSEASAPSASRSSIPRSVLLSPNRHPTIIGPRALPSVTPSERGSASSLGRGKPARRFGV